MDQPKDTVAVATSQRTHTAIKYFFILKKDQGEE